MKLARGGGISDDGGIPGIVRVSSRAPYDCNARSTSVPKAPPYEAGCPRPVERLRPGSGEGAWVGGSVEALGRRLSEDEGARLDGGGATPDYGDDRAGRRTASKGPTEGSPQERTGRQGGTTGL